MVSTASCMPPHRGKPLTMTSMRRSSPGTLPTLKSLTKVQPLHDKCVLPPVEVGCPALARHQLADMSPKRSCSFPHQHRLRQCVGSRTNSGQRAEHGAGTAAWLPRLHPSCRCGQPRFASPKMPTRLSATPDDAQCYLHAGSL